MKTTNCHLRIHRVFDSLVQDGSWGVTLSNGETVWSGRDATLPVAMEEVMGNVLQDYDSFDISEIDVQREVAK